MEQQQQDLILSWSIRQSPGPWDDWFEDKLKKTSEIKGNYWYNKKHYILDPNIASSREND